MPVTKDFPKGMFVLGLIFLLSGAMLMLSTAQESSENAPRWVGMLAGLMFFNAGVLVYMMDGFLNVFRQQWWFVWTQGLALVSIPVIMLVLFNWVAFGPGEREFSVSISIPFISTYFERGNELIGRAFFGIPTLFMDVLILGAVLKVGWDAVRNWINEEEPDTEGESD